MRLTTCINHEYRLFKRKYRCKMVQKSVVLCGLFIALSVSAAYIFTTYNLSDVRDKVSSAASKIYNMQMLNLFRSGKPGDDNKTYETTSVKPVPQKGLENNSVVTGSKQPAYMHRESATGTQWNKIMDLLKPKEVINSTFDGNVSHNEILKEHLKHLYLERMKNKAKIDALLKSKKVINNEFVGNVSHNEILNKHIDELNLEQMKNRVKIDSLLSQSLFKSHVKSDNHQNSNIGVNNTGVKVFDWSKPVRSGLKCVDLKIRKGKPKICVFNVYQDSSISRSLIFGGTYEEKQLNELQIALSANIDNNLIDIGANLGIYTLTAAEYGRYVVAIEPFHTLLPYLHKSVVINNFQNQITLLVNAVSNKKQIVRMVSKPRNLATAKIEEVPDNHVSKTLLDSGVQISTITMNEIIPFIKFRRAILKVDIPTNEPEILLTSNTFFDHVDIPYIFINWSHVKDHKMVKEVVDFLLERGYKPKRQIFGEFLDMLKYDLWTGEIIWIKQS